MSNNSSVLKSSIYITLFSFGGLTLGFISQLVIAYFFGASNERDAYFGAITIPTYITTLVNGSIGSIFLSYYIKIETTDSHEEAKAFFNSLMGMCLVLLFITSIFLFVFAREIVSFTVPGFSSSQNTLTVEMLRVLSPTIIFQSLTFIYGSIYQSRNKFVIAALPGVIAPVINLLFVFLFQKKIGITSLAWGNFLGNILSFSIFYFGLFRSRDILFGRKFIFNKNVLIFLRTATPLFISGIIFRSSGVWERFLGSKLPAGSISYLGYANQMLIVFSTLTTGGIATIFFPMLSKAWHNKDIESLRINFSNALSILLFIIIPVATIFIYLRVNIIELLFERGHFNHLVTIAVANTTAIMMGAFIFQSLGSIIVRSFYFMEKTVAVSIIGVFEIVVYISISYFLVKEFAYSGLAFAFSFAAMVNVFISTYLTNREINFLSKDFILTTGKIIFSSIIALSFLLLFNFQSKIILINILINTSIFSVIFLAISYMLKVSIAREIEKRIVTYLNKK